MKEKRKILFIRVLKIIGVSLFVILALMLLLPSLFADTITQKIKSLANNNLESEINFKDSQLSFFTHFPALTLTMNDFSMVGSPPFNKTNLVEAKEVGLGIRVLSLIRSKTINIDGIFIRNGKINIEVDKQGRANYNVYKAKEIKSHKDSTETSNTGLKLKIFNIDHCDLVYNDLSANFLIDAKQLNYVAKGHYIEADLELDSDLEIASLNFNYDNEQYFTNKYFKADLLTKLNTNSLSFLFEKNDLEINKLPLEFKGIFNILNNGYEMDLNLKTENSRLEDLFTALPPKYVTWMEKTKIKGNMNAFLNLKGVYSTIQNKSPDLNFAISLRDGYIQYADAPYPITNLFLDLKSQVPQLDLDQVKMEIDSIYFKVNNNELIGSAKTQALDSPISIDAELRSNIELGDISDALGLKDFRLNGHLNAHLRLQGTYNSDKQLFPKAKGDIKLMDGTIKTSYYPHPIEHINLSANISDDTGTFEGASLVIDKGEFIFEDEPFFLQASFQDFTDVKYKVKAKGIINVSRIYQVFVQKDLDLEGFIKANIDFSGRQSDATNGNYNKLNNNGTLELRNIKTTSTNFPQPFIIKEGMFHFREDDMTFSNFKASYGNSEAVMNGKMSNVINYYLFDKEILKGNFSLTSNHIHINEFISDTSHSIINQGNSVPQKENTPTNLDTLTSASVLQIPRNLDFQLKVLFKRLTYDSLEVNNLKGNLVLRQGVLRLQNGFLEIVGAKAKMNGFYQNEGTKKALFGYSINASQFDIHRAYNEIGMFQKLASWADKAEGIVSLDYQLKGVLDHQMQPILPSLEGKGTLGLKNIKVTGLPLLGEMAVKTSTDAVKNPEISDVEIHSNIKNNLVNIDEFKFKVKGFRLRFEGQTSLDGDINLKMRLGLPPFGIIGIPIKATGTSENPQISLGKKTEDLEEKKFRDELAKNPDSLALDSIPKSNAVPIKDIDSLRTKTTDSIVNLSKSADTINMEPKNKVKDTLSQIGQSQRDSMP